MQLCSPACQYLSRYIKRTARDRPGTSSQKKRRTKRREEKWEATAVTALLKATQTPRTRGKRAAPLAAPLFADDILSRKYRLRPSHRRRVQQPPGANVDDRVGAVHHSDSLKDIPDDRLSGRANNGGDTRAGVARGGGGDEGRKISQPCHLCGMHNQDSTGLKRESVHTLVPRLPVLSRAPMILNYAGIAGRSVPRPRWYLLDRAKNHEYGSLSRRDTRDTNDVLGPLRSPRPAWLVSVSLVHEKNIVPRDKRRNSLFPEHACLPLTARIATMEEISINVFA